MTAKPALAIASIDTFPKKSTALGWATSACILAADLAALSMVYWLAVLGRHLVGNGYHLSLYLDLFPCVAIFVGALFTQGLYPALLLHPADEIRRVFNCITIVCLVLAAGTFLWRNADFYSRSVFLAMWACGAPIVLLSRHVVRSMFSHRKWWGIPVVVLASNSSGPQFIRSLQNTRLGLRIAGLLSEDYLESWSSDAAPVRGGFAYAPLLAKANVAQYAIVDTSQSSSSEIRRIIQDYCKGFRHVLIIPGLTGLCSAGICAREVGGELGFELPQRLFHRRSAFFKRCLDILFSLTLLTLLLPLFILLSAAINLTSKGPVFYGHKRYGRDGKEFKAFKFRTMVENAGEVLEDHFRLHPEDWIEWQRDHKLKEDPRVTRIGKWLRRYSLDELPQMWNVLIGDMSLVGPRPIVHEEIHRYGSSGYDLYTRVLPGITGLWQVSGRNNTTYEERITFDEYYVRNWSIWLDAYILARTVRTVLLAEGAY